MSERTVLSAADFDRILRELEEPAVVSERLMKAARGVPHLHREFVPGCFRCDLSRDET